MCIDLQSTPDESEEIPPVINSSTNLSIMDGEQQVGQSSQSHNQLEEVPLEIVSSNSLSTMDGEQQVDGQSELFLDVLCAKGKSLYPDLAFTKRQRSDCDILEVSQVSTHYVPEAGSVSVARALFYPSVGNAGIYCYDIQALLTTIQKGETSSTDEGFEMCRIISNEGNYKFCPGIDCREYYENYFSIIRYNIASVGIWDRPFECVDSVNCLLWHQLKHNATYEEKESEEVLCRPCKRLCTDLDHQRRRSDVSSSKRIERLQLSSNFQWKFLSPISRSKRRVAAQRQRTRDKAKLVKLGELDVTLEDDQSDELCEIVSKIDDECKDEVESIFQEADAHFVTTGESLRSSWERDKHNNKAKFFKDQLKNSKLHITSVLVQYDHYTW